MEPNQNSSNMINGMPPLPQEHKKAGPIIGALVLVLVIIIAALYFLGQRTDTDTSATNEESATQEEVVRNEAANSNFDSATAAEFESDLDAQMSDVDYSF
ncbi:MAG TPA: hypothetical protein VJI66_03115 [Candidatus Paceibacterota bacterium]